MPNEGKTKYFSDISACADFIFSETGQDLKLGTALGLGKPNLLLNEIYRRAKADSAQRLSIFSALSLSVPKSNSELGKRFLAPFSEKHFANYVELDYVLDLQKNDLPSNIRVHEFYLSPKSYPAQGQAQRDYISLNYTHVAQALLERGIQAIVQLVAKNPNGATYSLSCNPDITVDLTALYERNKKPLHVIGVVHPDLPFLGGDAEVEPSFFTGILNPQQSSSLYAIPRTLVDDAEFWIGLHASRLIKDDGTLQIGIGALSDALVHATILRHQKNEIYREITQKIPVSSAAQAEIHEAPFTHGLYGTSEMMMDGFMHLRKAGILKREICDFEESKKRYLHAAFYLGSKALYDWLRNLPAEDAGIGMTRVSKVNDLYDAHELAIRRQRKNARFFNTSFSVTLLGGACSDTLENGEVLSGVGGQYNMVAMAKELPDALSILLLRSTRSKTGKRISNIVWSAGNLTIPRHLRDIVITEYGIAYLRGRTDEEVIQEILSVTDSEFQPALLAEAKRNNKISKEYQIPEAARRNSPSLLKESLRSHRKHFPAFPFGSDFTPAEEQLALALANLKNLTHSKMSLAKLLLKGLFTNAKPFRKELERMNLEQPKSLKEFFYQRLVLAALSKNGETHDPEIKVGKVSPLFS